MYICYLSGTCLLKQLPTLLFELLLCWYLVVIIDPSVMVDLGSCCATRGRWLEDVGCFRQLYGLVSLTPKHKTRGDNNDEYNGNENEGLAQRPVAPDPNYHDGENECEVRTVGCGSSIACASQTRDKRRRTA